MFKIGRYPCAETVEGVKPQVDASAPLALMTGRVRDSELTYELDDFGISELGITQ